VFGKHETEPIDERIERLLYADLTYDDHVEEKYGEASHKRMTELKALLLKSTEERELIAEAASYRRLAR
jgi:hypothetical protein